MPRDRKQIEIHTGLNKSAEEVGLSSSAAALHNCFVDVVDNHIVVNRRPGLKAFCDLGEAASVDGLYWWETQEKMVAYCNGKAFTIDDSSGSKTELTGSVLTAGKRVISDDNRTNVYAADQGVISKLTTSAIAALADGDAPQTASHLAFLDTYLLANNLNTNECHRSEVGTPDTWESNYFSAEAKEDNIKAILAENQELYLLGQRTLEVWHDTGASSPFERLPGGYVPSGTIAGYTFKWCADPVNTLVWLDNTKSLVALNGRMPQSLSGALDRYLQQDGYVLSDAAGDYFKTVGHPFYALHLPTQDETAVYDFKSGLWQNWSYYNSVSGDFERWRGNCVALAPAWGKLLVGDRANGKVYTLDQETYQDNSDTIKFLVRTGHIDRGDIGAWKRTNYVNFRAKKTGVAEGGATTVTLVVRYRNNGETTWSNDKTVTLSQVTGQTDYFGRLSRLGRYRTRQWEIYCTDNASVAILPPIEDYEVTY
jgi:hypothetical protein